MQSLVMEEGVGNCGVAGWWLEWKIYRHIISDILVYGTCFRVENLKLHIIILLHAELISRAVLHDCINSSERYFFKFFI